MAFGHTKQDKIDNRYVKFVFISYLKGVNKLIVVEDGLGGGSISMISRDVNFDEIHMCMKCKNFEKLDS